jgi:hypothetical protein
MDALVKDCWGVVNGTLTPGANGWGIDTFKLSEYKDGFICRPCIKEVGMPYCIGRRLVPGLKNPWFNVLGMACEVWAANVNAGTLESFLRPM